MSHANASEAAQAARTSTGRHERPDGDRPSVSSNRIMHTPAPRLAIRIGVSGHRPDRLGRSLEAINRSRRADGLADWDDAAFHRHLADQMASVFAALDRDVATVAETLAVPSPGQGASARIYATDQPPLLRLVVGAALGADRMAINLVDGQFRRAGGAAEQASAESPLHPDRRAQWQIDMILPCGPTRFALEASGDFEGEPALHAGDGSPTSVGYWQSTFERADTLVCLPPTWRLTPAAARPSPCRAHGDALVAAFGPLDEPPEPPAGQRYTLDHVRAAEFLLRQIDILVAIWDGEPANGPGGTADIVAKAVEAGIPVVLLDPDAPHLPPRLVKSVQRDETRPGVVGWYPAPKKVDAEGADARIESIRTELLKIAGIPEGPKHHHAEADSNHGDHRDGAQKLQQFLGETWPLAKTSKAYDIFVDVMRLKWRSAAGRFRSSPADGHWIKQSWADFVDANPDEGQQATRLKGLLYQRFVAADLLAVAYADRYRATFIKSYLLAAIAVLIALVSFVADVPHEAALPVKGLLVLVELLVIFWISELVRNGEREHLHTKFMDYRGLAESLRHMRFLATFAEFAQYASPARSEATWWNWYLRATAREIGLPSGTLGPTYQKSLLGAVRTFEIGPQIVHHTTAMEKTHGADHSIHTVGRATFRATFWLLAVTAAVIGMAILWASWKAQGLPKSLLDIGPLVESQVPAVYHVLLDYKKWIGFFAALLPAVGASLAGIRFTADFDGKAERSAAMIRELTEVDANLAAAAHTQDFDETRAALTDAAEVLAEDVAAFLSLYGRKRLTLPG